MPRSDMIEDFSTPRALHAAPTPAPETPAAPTAFVLVDPIAMLGRPGYLGTRKEIETELDVVALGSRAWHHKQPDQVMREVAAFSARLTELAMLLHRVESTDRNYTRIRTQQVERLLAEMDRQFKIASRIVEVQRQDLELLR